MKTIGDLDLASPLLDHCPASLDAETYWDPTWHAADLDAIWSANWIHVGRLADFPVASLRRIPVLNANILFVRQPDGTLKAFHNTCRHRGAELCREEFRALSSKLVVCPYHQWSYDLDGKLIRPSNAIVTADFRSEEHGLLDVALTIWAGSVFVCLEKMPPDFALAPDLGLDALNHWPMDDLVVGHRLETELDCNWKIFWENYNECLHCPSIHPELSALVPIYQKGFMAEQEMPGFAPEAGQSHSPLRDGARSWTMNGQACGPEFAGLTDKERLAGMTFVTLLPTMFIVAHVDYVRMVTVMPLGPERTRLTVEWLFLPQTLQREGFDLANVTDFATLVLRQDGDACEMNQRGLKAPGFVSGRLMPQEFDVYRFHQWVRRHHQARPS